MDGTDNTNKSAWTNPLLAPWPPGVDVRFVELRGEPMFQLRPGACMTCAHLYTRMANDHLKRRFRYGESEVCDESVPEPLRFCHGGYPVFVCGLEE